MSNSQPAHGPERAARPPESQAAPAVIRRRAGWTSANYLHGLLMNFVAASVTYSKAAATVSVIQIWLGHQEQSGRKAKAAGWTVV